LDNNCIHMDLGAFHNMVGREVDGKMELNLIDWQSIGAQNIFNLGMMKRFYPEKKKKFWEDFRAAYDNDPITLTPQKRSILKAGNICKRNMMIFMEKIGS